jgi:Sec-independent protein translocase protein TatA
VSSRKQHEIWIEQCEAARTIKARYGLKAAFDYLVGEKLMNFASAASKYPEFAREFPRFISAVRRMFTREEMRTHIARLEREQSENAIDVSEEDELSRESPAAAAERVRQFTTVKELLTATELGTS